ncbi:MAG TPA: hypothetical protein VFK05_29530 [Polyangiaceae bacterium]|nr:hypothetical protein [Polyangiaceae bacterium]
MAELMNAALRNMASDLWAPANWSPYFPHRACLSEELALLDQLFPLDWRLKALREPSSRHQLRGDLLTVGGRTRLLDLAAELLRIVGSATGQPIPMQGRLRYWNLYQSTRSELLVGPVLRSIGDVAWQPERNGPGADYQLVHASGVHVAEVKRLCTSVRQEQVAMGRLAANMAHSGPVFTAEEQTQNAREDARRLYPRVRHAAKQLKQSAARAARQFSRLARSIPGILFLDLDGNPYLGNIAESIHGWMDLPWARPIDLILFFDFGYRGGAWGTTVGPIYSRSGQAFNTLARALPRCSRGHFHFGNRPAGPCEYPLPL